MLRPQPTRWFEIIAARSDAFLALEALAAAGCVEVEWHATDRLPGASGYPAELLKQCEELERNYSAYWPQPASRLAPERRAPADALAAAVAKVQEWATAADAVIKRLQDIESRVAGLSLTQKALEELADSQLDFAALAQAKHGVVAALLALPLDADVNLPVNALTRVATLPNERLVLAVGAPAVVESAAQAVLEAGGRRAHFPDWLQPTATANLALVAGKLEEERGKLLPVRAQLDALAERHALADALGTVARAAWCFEHGGAIDAGDVFARVTGWTVDPQRVIDAIEHCGARAVIAFPAPPRGVRPPLVLRNPWWAQPFEVFTRLVGMPGPGGADPSTLLALAVPLMFGYMFGDVGQGLVLALAGWLLRHRLPVLRLLVPAGLAAAAFGFVFGSVFSLETVIHPLWVAPLEQPLPVLVAPIVGGAVLLALGLLLGALEAWWDGLAARWWLEDAPVLLTYVGLAVGIVDPSGWLLAAAGAIWAMVGAAVEGRSPKALLTGLGEWLERTLQLAINTLSFARIGAFALAHAGLSSAVVALADAAANPVAYVLILVLGNVLILLIEGLVVSIQTTRLVLFEFFTRFFHAEGREFRVLAAPPVTTEEK
jgi:V/A-type H+/Na+-transporting ATPase subunit I